MDKVRNQVFTAIKNEMEHGKNQISDRIEQVLSAIRNSVVTTHTTSIANTVDGANNTNYINTVVITANSENHANDAINTVQYLGRASATVCSIKETYK